MTKKTKKESDETPEVSDSDEELDERSDQDDEEPAAPEDDEGDDSEERDDDEDDEDDLDASDDEEEEEGDEELPDGGSGRNRNPKPAEVAALAVFLLIGAAFGINGWVNVQAADAVGQRCGVAEQQMNHLIEQGERTPLLSPNWLQSFRRARRLYIREICDRTVDRLAWWRWNLLRPVEIRLSHEAEQDIERTLVRAGSSCSSEITDNEQAFERALEREIIDPQVRTIIVESFEWQRQACGELGESVEGGYWPPLRARGPSDVPEAMAEIMPDSQMPAREEQGGEK